MMIIKIGINTSVIKPPCYKTKAAISLKSSKNRSIRRFFYTSRYWAEIALFFGHFTGAPSIINFYNTLKIRVEVFKIVVVSLAHCKRWNRDDIFGVNALVDLSQRIIFCFFSLEQRFIVFAINDLPHTF